MGVVLKVLVLSVVFNDLWYAKMTLAKLKAEFDKVFFLGESLAKVFFLAKNGRFEKKKD